MIVKPNALGCRDLPWIEDNKANEKAAEVSPCGLL